MFEGAGFAFADIDKPDRPGLITGLRQGKSGAAALQHACHRGMFLAWIRCLCLDETVVGLILLPGLRSGPPLY